MARQKIQFDVWTTTLGMLPGADEPESVTEIHTVEAVSAGRAVSIAESSAIRGFKDRMPMAEKVVVIRIGVERYETEDQLYVF